MSYSATTIQEIDGSTFRPKKDDEFETYVTDELGRLVLTGKESVPHAEYLPTFDPNEKFGVLEEFEHIDPGHSADPTFPNLFPKNVKYSTDNLSPKFGTEVEGIQLSKLSKEGKNELALYVAQRGVVVFRDQDLAELSIEQVLEYGSHFGRHHIHPTSGAPKGYPEIHLVHRSRDDTFDDFFKQHTTSTAWHSDVTYEKQPPGTTFLAILDTPPSGGDTAFADTREAYSRLSPAFKERLSGLHAVHSAFEQAEASRSKGGVVRREPVQNIHPIVRQHPVTKDKALFVNPQFTRKIVEFKDEESQHLLNFLYDHVAKGIDFQIRARWRPRTVVVWDNRIALHSAILDWSGGHRRHAFRITPQAERPKEEWE